MSDTLRTLEVISKVAPLGVAFCDAMDGSGVDQGLSVTVFQEDRYAQRAASVVNARGVHVWHRLPFSKLSPFGSGDAKYWTDHPPREPYLIEVKDGLRRYLDCRMVVTTPVRGLFVPQSVKTLRHPAPPFRAFALGDALRVPLFPRPGRPPRSGFARVFGRLSQQDPTRSTAHACVELSLGDRILVLALCDESGCFELSFAYPTPGRLVAGQAPSWTFELRVRLSKNSDPAALPELSSALAQLRGEIVNPPQFRLRYGEPCDVRTLVVRTLDPA